MSELIPRIIWQKCENPYRTLDNNELLQEKIEADKDMPDGNFMDDPGIPTFDDDMEGMSRGKNISCMFTPLGIIPLNEYTDLYNVFNFWTGHTNFGITKRLAPIIEMVPGVEIFHVFSRYRMRVGIGKAFKDREVMAAINHSVTNYFKKPKE